MKVVHWAMNNGSGLNNVSTNMNLAEISLGIDSYVSYTIQMANPIPEGVRVLEEKDALEADVHVIHSHLPDKAKGKTVFIAHGTPEHCFYTAIEQNKASGFTAGDAMMLSMYRIGRCDAAVTFWPRHQWIWQSLNPKANVYCVPLGIDTDFWKPVSSKGKWVGNPSIFSCENSHSIKWPLDIILMFPLVMKESDAVIHLHYMPMDQHRFWYPLMNANGTMYKSYTSGMYMDKENLRNAYVSVDYYINPVRYGDFNCITLEAKASGCRLISYAGNPYADYWLTEGDQRIMAEQVLDIINGKTEPRKDAESPASRETMAKEMIKIYEKITK